MAYKRDVMKTVHTILIGSNRSGGINISFNGNLIQMVYLFRYDFRNVGSGYFNIVNEKEFLLKAPICRQPQ